MKSFKKFVAMAASLALTMAAAMADVPVREQFAWSIPLEVPAGAPVVRLDVPLGVYRDCVYPQLRDVRVLNGAGEIVPFALQAPEAAVRAAPTTVRVQLFSLSGAAAASGAALELHFDGASTSIEVAGAAAQSASPQISAWLVDSGSIDRPIDSLTFSWPEDSPDFAINVVIEISEDLVSWREIVARAPLARLRQGGAVFEQRSVPVPATHTRFWRVSAQGEANLPQITAADATLVMASVPVERMQLEAAGAAVLEQPGTYDFDLGAKLPVDQVALDLPDINTVAAVEYFARSGTPPEWRRLAATSVYRMQTGNGELISPSLAVNTEAARYWRVKVDPRGGGIGSGVPRLRAGWLPHRLVFVTRGRGPFELVYGNVDAEAAEVPLDTLLPADAAGLAARGANLPVTRAGERREAGGPERLLPAAPPKPWRAWVLWIALLAGVATLGALAWNLARQMRAAS